MAKEYPAALLTAAMFLVVNVSALILSVPFLSNQVMSYQAFEDPGDPVNPLIYIVMIIIFSVVMLLLIRFMKEKMIKYLIMFSVFSALMYVFLLPGVYGVSFLTGYPPYNLWVFLIGVTIAVIISAFLISLLNSNPEWYVVDGIGILIATGITAILGISLGILPMMILLIGLAVYDYIAVYKTKHMIKLADAVTKQRVPVMLVVPSTEDYSFKESQGFSEEKKKVKKGKRDALFIGLGDVVIPGALTVSAFVFLPVEEVVFGITTNLLMSCAVFAGTMVGFYILSKMVGKGKAHAGLPLLNGGAILSFLIAYVIIYQDFAFGLGLWGA